MLKTSIDLGAESAFNDFILRSESAQNDLISKSRLHSIYGKVTKSDNASQFLFDIEHFLSDIRGPRYLKKVYFFVGHPVSIQ